MYSENITGTELRLDRWPLGKLCTLSPYYQTRKPTNRNQTASMVISETVLSKPVTLRNSPNQQKRLVFTTKQTKSTGRNQRTLFVLIPLNLLKTTLFPSIHMAPPAARNRNRNRRRTRLPISSDFSSQRVFPRNISYRGPRRVWWSATPVLRDQTTNVGSGRSQTRVSEVGGYRHFKCALPSICQTQKIMCPCLGDPLFNLSPSIRSETHHSFLSCTVLFFFFFFWLGLPNPVPSEPSTPSLSRVYHFPDFYSCSRPWFIPRALLSLSVSLVAFRICMLLRLSSLPLPLIVNNFWSIIRLGQIVTRLSLPTFSGISKSNSP